MKQIRRSVFETNSSSSHCISIGKRHQNKNDIPLNSDFELVLLSEPYANGEEHHDATICYCSRLGKLRYLVNILYSIINSDIPNKYLTEYKGTIDNWKYTPTKDERKDWLTAIFNIKYFTWLFEAIKEKTGTTVFIDIDPIIEDSYGSGFLEVTYDENSSLIEVLGLTNAEFEDEAAFKTRMTEIIFNDEIVIMDEDRAYCSCEEATYREE